MNKKRRIAASVAFAALALGTVFPRALRAGGRGSAGVGSGQFGGSQNSGSGGSQNNAYENNGNQNNNGQNNGNQNNGGQNNNGQNNNQGNNQNNNNQNNPGSGNQDVSAVPEARVPDPELTIEDAREDFQTIVESFLLKNTRDGSWPFADARGRKRGLALVSVETSTVSRVSLRRYAGLVRLREVASGKTVKLLFTVDLSGDDWRVVSFAEPRAAKKSDAGK